jgi:hypothetical protein
MVGGFSLRRLAYSSAVRSGRCWSGGAMKVGCSSYHCLVRETESKSKGWWSQGKGFRWEKWPWLANLEQGKRKGPTMASLSGPHLVNDTSMGVAPLQSLCCHMLQGRGVSHNLLLRGQGVEEEAQFDGGEATLEKNEEER